MSMLTHRQLEALRFITGFVEAKGRSPSYPEIADGLGYRNKGSAHDVVMRLEDRGCVQVRPGQVRGIQVVTPVAIPRACDGKALFFVRVEGGAV